MYVNIDRSQTYIEHILLNIYKIVNICNSIDRKNTHQIHDSGCHWGLDRGRGEA